MSRPEHLAGGRNLAMLQHSGVVGGYGHVPGGGVGDMATTFMVVARTGVAGHASGAPGVRIQPCS